MSCFNDEKLKEQFFNTFKFSNHGLLLQKGVYPYEYMDNFLSIKFFFHRHWRFTRQQGDEGGHLFLPAHM